MIPRVVVLDSGVHATHPHVAPAMAAPVPGGGGERLSFGPLVAPDGSLQDSPSGADRLGHGTCAAAAILERVPDVLLHSIRLFDDTDRCTTTALVAGLEAALEWGPDVVNLSAGSTDVEVPVAMSAAVHRAREAGVRVVAPAAWHGLPAWPGALEGVDGVLIDATLPRHEPVRREQPGHAFWYASPLPRPIEGVAPSANLAGVSVACAHVTAQLLVERASVR